MLPRYTTAIVSRWPLLIRSLFYDTGIAPMWDGIQYYVHGSLSAEQLQVACQSSQSHEHYKKLHSLGNKSYRIARPLSTGIWAMDSSKPRTQKEKKTGKMQIKLVCQFTTLKQEIRIMQRNNVPSFCLKAVPLGSYVCTIDSQGTLYMRDK